MSLSHTIQRTYIDTSGVAIIQTEKPTGDNENNLDVSAPVANNTHFVWGATIANLLALCIYASAAITIYTNAASGGSPQDTIAIAAGQTFVWTAATDGSGKLPFSGNVTSLYVTNAGSGAASLKIRALVNE
jgi:hypothetical protein